MGKDDDAVMGSVRRETSRLATAAMLLLMGLPGFTHGRARLVESPDLHVPHEPSAVRISGKLHLVYELHITNLRASDISLTRVEVLDANRVSATLADFRDTALDDALGQAARGITDKRLIAAGVRAVLYVWLPLDTADANPSKLSHRIEFDIIRPSGRERAVTQSGLLAVNQDAPVALSPPLRGGRWVALYDPSASRGHRRVLYALDGRARIPARFAIDWMKLGEDGKFARGDESRIANWYGYGADVLAVADGVVVEAHDDVPEEPTIADRPAPVALESASGNYVVLDLRNGRYAFYEHLKHGSIRVKAGDQVRSGQVLGLLGNSGSSSSGPHLHFHVSDARSPLGAEGLPFVLSSFDVRGAFNSMSSVGTGVAPSPLPEGVKARRSLELPAANTVVEF